MAKYCIGDELYFHADLDTYHICKGDLAVIKAKKVDDMWSVCFDRNVRGHDCDIPHLIPWGHGWFLCNTLLDAKATVINKTNEIDISNTKLEEVL